MRLVEDLLDMARIISGKLRLKIDTVSLPELAQAAIDVVTPGAAAKQVAIHADFEPDLPDITGDAERLQQVVWNLLSNAVKFTESGGTVSVEASRVGANVRLVVRDNGQGIAPDFLPYVFDRFRQADASASRRHGGLGLGLALVRQIVELHGGAVGVDSRGVKQGASFWITLPALVGAAATRSLPAEATAEPITLKGVSILIVDDETDAREMLTAMLQDYGALVQAVESASAAMTVLSGDDFTPDVLISDVGMPGTDGFALVREIRNLPSDRRKLPAIAVTAYANPEDRVRALVAGYQTHIPKPVDANILAAAIAKLVVR
jgi:CheY-like chemotaxis protein/two-component sensor histidine kinase